MRLRGMAIGAVVALGMLGACDNGPSAVATRDRSAATSDVALVADTAPTEAIEVEAPVEKTALTANRRESVDAKVMRLYERNGSDFGARSPEDFVAKVEAFTKNPPSGVDTAKRPNGDTLMYQASTNTFAVVARDGTPRTMFKPDDGAAYWAQQKERAPTFGQRRSQADN